MGKGYVMTLRSVNAATLESVVSVWFENWGSRILVPPPFLPFLSLPPLQILGVPTPNPPRLTPLSRVVIMTKEQIVRRATA